MKVENDIIKFIDYIVNCITNGKYYFYQVCYIPQNKYADKAFLEGFTAKIDNKYKTNLTKYQRLNARRQDKARFLAVRYEHIVLILKTKGDTEIAVKEKWNDIRKKKIELKITEHTTYVIGSGASKRARKGGLGSTVTVTLGKDTYNLIKLSCLDAIRVKKSIPMLIWEWNKINGFNGWSGINKQKLQLKDYLAREVCANFGMKKHKAKKLFRVNTYRAKCNKEREEIEKANLQEACLERAADINAAANAAVS